MWKIAPALLAGNTIVLKPSPFTPITTLMLGEILRELVPPRSAQRDIGRRRSGRVDDQSSGAAKDFIHRLG